jgi:hypothetical protein
MTCGDIQLDESLLEQQQQAYVVQGVDETEPAVNPRKKRKQELVNGENVGTFISCWWTTHWTDHPWGNIGRGRSFGIDKKVETCA